MSRTNCPLAPRCAVLSVPSARLAFSAALAATSRSVLIRVSYLAALDVRKCARKLATAPFIVQ